MKKWLAGIGSVVLLMALAFCSWAAVDYYRDEQQIARVSHFRETALQAFQALGYDRVDQAVALYEQALSIHGEDAKTLADYALALKKAKRFDESANNYLKSYLLDRTQSDKSLANAGLLFLQQGRYGEAMAAYETLLKDHKLLYRYVDKIALCAFRLGDTDKALSHYAYIVERKVDWFDDKPEFDELRILYEQHDGVAAVDLREVHEISTDLGELADAARELEEQHYDKQAVFTYQRLLEIEPGNVMARRKAAKLFLGHGNYSNALELLEKVEEKSYDDWFTIGGIHHENRRYALALDNYKRALELRTEATLLKNMCSCAYYLKDTERLAKLFIRLKDTDPLLAYQFQHAVETSQGDEESAIARFVYHARSNWYQAFGVLLVRLF